MSEDNEELDSQNQEADDAVEVEDTQADVAEAEELDVDKLQESNKRLFNRAKKAEADLKALKEAPPTQSTNSQPVSADPDELRLIAKGLSDEEIDQAKVIAKGTDTTLAEAIKSPLFTAFQKDLKEQQRKDKAKLSASSGSSQEVPKSLSDTTRDEHQKIAMEAAQNIQ